MKKLIFVLLVVLNISAFGQEIPKRAWKIVIKNTLSADENFSLIGRTLADNDYIIESKDKEFGTIKTGIRSAPGNGSGRYFFTFSAREGAIAITGQTNSDISINLGGVRAESAFEKISNRGSKRSYMMKAFVLMNEFALKLGSNQEYITD